MNKFEYALPENVADVFNYLQEPNSVIKAGGVDLVDLMKEGILQPKRLVNVQTVTGLKFVNEDPKRGLILGPNNTLGELAENEKLITRYHALAQAADSAATPQIRNMATLAGNLCQRPRCWYFRNHDFPCTRKGGDTCFAAEGENQYHAILGNGDGCVIVHPSATAVALMALNAKLKIVSSGSEREVPLEEFFVPPVKDINRENILHKGEMITEIILPAVPKGSSSFYYKQKEKQAFDWPIAEVAVSLTLEGKNCVEARVILGSAAPVPWRALNAEAVLKGQKITKEISKKAAEEAMKGATPLTQNGYKVPVFKAIISRTICWAAGINPFE